jgi:hypothetical protein
MMYSETVIYAFCNFICSIGLIKNPLGTMFSLRVPIWEMIVCVCACARVKRRWVF